MISINNLIAEINEELKLRYHDYRGVYLHGSRLREKVNEDSDYDLVFVFDRKIDWKFKKEISDILYEIELKYEILIDARIYSFKEIETPTTFFKETIRQEGKFFEQ